VGGDTCRRLPYGGVATVSATRTVRRRRVGDPWYEPVWARPSRG